MHQMLEEICVKLDELADALEAISWDSVDTRLTKNVSWNAPAISPQQIFQLTRNISSGVRQANIEELSQADLNAVPQVMSALVGIEKEMLPNLAGSPLPGVLGYLATLNYCVMVLGPLHGWSTIQPGALPSALARKLNTTERELARIAPEKLQLQEKIQSIVEAYTAAEALPTTHQELKATLAEVRLASSTASELVGTLKRDADAGEKALSDLVAAAEEGSAVKAQIEEAFQMATTKGLAASFEARANNLNFSLYIWVVGLAVALSIAMVIGYHRLDAMKLSLAAEPFRSGRVWAQTLLTILSVAAPVWFAWIATKQIGQRFRLAEDYAFKASVAKAYEGYRRQAVSIDPEFEKILFASALTRLDEAPLRLLEMSTHGSPAHEFVDSDVIKDLLSRATSIPKRLKRSSTAPVAPSIPANTAESSTSAPEAT